MAEKKRKRKGTGMKGAHHQGWTQAPHQSWCWYDKERSGKVP
tara:strand:+ start:589 stop:714 length:126 start_codon:yes stop_codon:yes gene_type:complete